MITWLGWVLAILTVLAAGIWFLPWYFGLFLRLVFLPRYGYRVWGRENVPMRGAAVVIANHVAWIDGLFLRAVFPRRAQALTNAAMIKGRFLRWLTTRLGAIPVPFTGPKAQRAAIQACRDALDRGEVVVIFPEGQLTRNGFPGSFYRGLELILRGKDMVPVVPVYLDNLWGSNLSYSGGKTFGKPIKGLRRTIGVSYGPPVVGKVDLFRLRQAMLEASVVALAARKRKPDELETIDLSLPHFIHPKFGLLAASTPNCDIGGVHQDGQRDGTVGQALPGVVIRAVDEGGQPLGENAVGRLQALVAGQAHHWVGLGRRGSVDKDGFVRVV